MKNKSETKYLMPNFDKKHTAISARITSLQFLKKMTHVELLEDSGVNSIEFSKMEFCYDPKNDSDLKIMINWLEKNEQLLRDYFGDSYYNSFEPLKKYYSEYM